MLGLCFQGHGSAQEDEFRGVAGKHIGDSGLAGGQGAGLVQQDGTGPVEVLQGFGILKENAHFCSPARTNHDGHRGSQSQSTGAGNDQHRNGGGQRKFKGLSRHHPDGEGHGGDAHDHGHENACDLIRQTGDGGLAAAGLLHHADDLGKGRILAHLVRPEFQITGGIDGGGGDGVAGFLLHGHGFAGEGALIHGGTAFDDGAVHRDAAAGFDDDRVPYPNLIGGYLLLHAVPAHQGGLGCQIHELADGVAGLALGPGLQEFTQSDEGQDHGGGFKIEILAVMLHDVPLAVSLGPGHPQQRRQTIDQAGTGAHGDEGIHIGTAVPQGLQALAVISPVQEHGGQCQQKLHQRKEGGVLETVENVGRGQGNHVAHGQVHQHRQKSTGPDDPGFHFLQRILSGSLGLFRLFAIVNGCAVARIGDSLADLAADGLAFHLGHHSARQQIHLRPGDTGNSLRHLLHPGRTGGAGHARHLKFHFHPKSHPLLTIVHRCDTIISENIICASMHYFGSQYYV